MRPGSFLTGTVIINRSRFITNWGSSYSEPRQRLLQIGTTVIITNEAKLLQIGSYFFPNRTTTTNWGNFYKSVHNKVCTLITIRNNIKSVYESSYPKCLGKKSIPAPKLTITKNLRSKTLIIRNTPN